MQVDIVTAAISGVAGLIGAFGGAWWGGRMTYKAAKLRYEALVWGTYKREWVTNLRAAISDFLGQTHLFVSGTAYSGVIGEDRVNLIRDLDIAKTKVQVLLDSEVEEQAKLRNLCRDLFANLSSHRRLNNNKERAIEMINEIAEMTESISRCEIDQLEEPNA